MCFCLLSSIVTFPASIPSDAPTSVKRAREKFLNFHGAKLCNIFPKSLRNENSANFPLFKKHLDIFLDKIPDQPTMAGLSRAAVTNSLLEQVPMVPDLDLG